MGNAFTWIQTREETVRTLAAVTLTARFLAVGRLRRQTGTTAKLWISQIYTRKALLEDSKLGSPIHLPETLYLEILVGQMSAQETTVFGGIPSIGDDLLAKDAREALRYTLDKVKRSIDACSNPPYFRGVKTPTTDLLDSPEVKPTKEHGQRKNRTRRRIRPTRNQTPHLAPTPKINPISPAAPSMNNPLNSPKGSKDLTWKPSSTARKSPLNSSVSFTMILKEASAPAVTRMATIEKVARTPKLNGKRISIKNN